jgi:hypothetical protein
MSDHGCPVEVESVLRIRPLLNKERDDQVLLRPQKQHAGRKTVPSVVLDAFHNGSMMSPRNDTNASSEYHFNTVLPEDTSQDKLYFSLGLPIATSTMDSLKLATSKGERDTSKSHLLICMGVGNSGKTHTCFGGSSIPKRRSAQDGLVPRLVDSFFSQSKHHHGQGGSKQFSVQISIVQVTQTKGKDPHACQIQDLLAPTSRDRGVSPPKRTKSSVLSMIKNLERPAMPSPIRSAFASTEFTELDVEDLRPTFKSCKDVTEAREVLQAGLSGSKKASTGNRTHHLMITMQPVYDDRYFGDKIAVLDMAGLEKGKRGLNRGGKDAIPNVNQATNAAVLHCLRTLLHNTNARSGKRGALDIMCPDDDESEISCVSQARKPYQNSLKTVPFRQHKLTMVMKSLFTSSLSAKVTLLLAAYPGHTDYSEKRTLLQDMELLCGASLLSSNAAVKTGFEEEEDDVSASEGSATSESIDQYHVRSAPTRAMPSRHRPDPVKPSRSLVPSASMSDEEDEEIENVSMPPPFAPKSRREPPKAYARWLARPSAPSSEDICAPPPEKTIVANACLKESNVASDFPGVRLPSKTVESSPLVERLKTATIWPSSMVGGPKAQAPPSPDEMSWVSRSAGGPKAKELSSSKQAPCESHNTGPSTSSKPSQGLNSARGKERLQPPFRGLPAKTSLSQDEMTWSSGGNSPSTSTTPLRVSRKSSEKRPLQPSNSMNLESPPSKSIQLKSHHKLKPVAKLMSNPLDAERIQVEASIEGNFSSFPSENSQSSNSQENSSSHLWREAANSKAGRLGVPPPEMEEVTQSTRGHGKRKESPVEDADESPSRKKRESQRLDDLSRQVKDLERRLRESLQQNKEIENRCRNFEKENADLKICAREAGRKQMQSKWTEQEEEEWLQSRRMRHEDQKLVQGPLMEHIEKVNKVYDIKNQWAISHKPQFGLHLPLNFQRASALDVRDKEKQKSEIAVKKAVSTVKTTTSSFTTRRTATSSRTPPRAVKLFS